MNKKLLLTALALICLVSGQGLKLRPAMNFGGPAHELVFSVSFGIKGKVLSILFGNRLISMTVVGRDDDLSLDTSTKRFIDSLILMDE